MIQKELEEQIRNTLSAETQRYLKFSLEERKKDDGIKALETLIDRAKQSSSQELPAGQIADIIMSSKASYPAGLADASMQPHRPVSPEGLMADLLGFALSEESGRGKIDHRILVEAAQIVAQKATDDLKQFKKTNPVKRWLFGPDPKVVHRRATEFPFIADVVQQSLSPSDTISSAQNFSKQPCSTTPSS